MDKHSKNGAGSGGKEVTMLELLESLIMVVLLVPVVMVLILGSIYLLGELFNIISKIGQPAQRRAEKQGENRV